MPLLPVAVEIAPPDAPRAQVVALLSACSRAVADTECVVATEASDARPSAVAIVTWHDGVNAVVEVGRLRQGQPEWRTRALEFEIADSAVERWRTVGFVVGTLARGETALSEPLERPPDKRLQPEPPEPVAAPAPGRVDDEAPTARRAATRPAAQAAVDLGVATGQALSGVRAGALLRSRWPLYRALRGFAGARYLQLRLENQGYDLDASWLTLGAGLGVITSLSGLELSAALDLRAESFSTQAESPLSNRTDSASRWLAGAGLNGAVAWMPLQRVGVFVSADAGWMFGAVTDIEVREQRAVQDASFRFTAEGGVRVHLW